MLPQVHQKMYNFLFPHVCEGDLLLCRLPSILEYLKEPLLAGLGDRSAYVRKTAVMGIVKVFYIAPEFITGMSNQKKKTWVNFVYNTTQYVCMLTLG